MMILERAGDPLKQDLRRLLRSKGRDLNQCLEEERQVTKLKPSRMTPIYAASNNTGGGNASAKITTNVKPAPEATTAEGRQSSSSKYCHFMPFEFPFVIIEDADLFMAPAYKQYPPHPSGRVSFPVLRSDLANYQCPFYYNTKPRPNQVYHSYLFTINDPSVDDLLGALEDRKPKAAAKQSTKPTNFGGDPAKREAFNPKAKPGYCECCCEKYKSVREHIMSLRHREFAKINENYQMVDELINAMDSRPFHYDFNPIIAFTKVQKSSQVSIVQSSCATMMSPAQSIVNKKASLGIHMGSSLRENQKLPIMAEDKENDSPSGLDLTGVDKGYSEKRRIMTASSDIFQTDFNQEIPAPRKKAKRTSLLQSIKF